MTIVDFGNIKIILLTKKYVHIGLGKTGTTSLQENLFPKIAKKKKLEYFDRKKLFNYFGISLNKFDTENKFHPLKNVKKKFTKNKYLVSFEGLVGHSNYFTKCRNINLDIFGKDVAIIITIRDPKNFLNSTYIQQSFHEMLFLKEKDFFSKPVGKLKIPLSNYCVDYFDYLKLAKLYKKKFKEVHIIKYSKNYEKKILKIFNCKLKITSKNIFNKSLNLSQIKFLKFLNNSLRILTFNILNLRVLMKFSYFLRYKTKSKAIHYFATLFDLYFIIQKFRIFNNSSKKFISTYLYKNKKLRKLEFQFENIK